LELFEKKVLRNNAQASNIICALYAWNTLIMGDSVFGAEQNSIVFQMNTEPNNKAIYKLETYHTHLRA